MSSSPAQANNSNPASVSLEHSADPASEMDRTAEARLQLLLDLAHIIPWEADPLTASFSYIGPQVESILGYPVAEWYRPNFCYSRIHPLDRDRAISDWVKLSRARDRHEAEYRMVARNGRTVWLRSLVTLTRESAKPKLVHGFSVDVTASHQMEDALRDLGGRLINAQEEERSRIARELHDDLSQKMAMLSIELGLVDETANDPASLRLRIENIQNQAEEISADIHRLSHRLHPSKLDHLGLAAALKGLCEQLNANGKPRVYLHQQGFDKTLPKDITLCIFRIAQEALRNAVKHSRADQVRVIVKQSGDVIHLSVEDNGCGFDPHSSAVAGGLGFISMRERLRIVNGEFEVNSEPSRGTRIEARIPLGRLIGTAEQRELIIDRRDYATNTSNFSRRS